MVRKLRINENSNINYPILDAMELSERIYGYDDNIKIYTTEELGNDIIYHKKCYDEHDVEKFNFHSDRWGDADYYQEQALDVMREIEPYIGNKVIIPFDEGNVSATVVTMLIDKQYNNHIKILIDDVEELN